MKSIFKRCTGLLVTAIIATGVMAGCSAEAVGDETTGKLTITDFADRKLAFAETPQRIVALGNGEVDIIYALGGSVVGRPVDSGAYVPEGARDAQQIGSVHTVDLEKIAMARPDVVLGNDPINASDIPKLESIGVKTILTHANSIEDIRRQIELFGRLLEREEKAGELIAELDTALEQAAERQSKSEQAGQNKPRVLLVYGAPGTYLAALPNSLAGDLLETAGGLNVAAELPRLQNFPQYAQLNTERVVEASPDIIMIMTHGNTEEVEKGFIREMESNTAWSSLTAVRDGRIHVLPAELFGTNPGTRAAEAVELLEELFRS